MGAGAACGGRGEGVVGEVTTCDVEDELEEDVAPAECRERVVREEVRLHARRGFCSC